jgi:stress response protein SCP2
VAVAPCPADVSGRKNFREGEDYICKNGGHCVYKEELQAWFGTDGAGITKLLDKSIVFTDAKIDAWVKEELDKQTTEITADAKTKAAEKNKGRVAARAAKKAAAQIVRDQNKIERQKVREAAEAEYEKKMEHIKQKEQEKRERAAKEEEAKKLVADAEQWHEELKTQADMKHQKEQELNAVHARAEKHLKINTVKLGQITTDLRHRSEDFAILNDSVDLAVNGTYSSDAQDAIRHVLAVVDASASMQPLLSEVKTAIADIVKRKDVHTHLTVHSRVEADDAPELNLASDTMGMEKGEAVSLDSNISAVRIKCSWANAVEDAACDLDSGIVLYEGTKLYKTCNYQNKKVDDAVTLNTDARGDDAESEEILVCKLDKLPLTVTTAVVYLLNYGGGTFADAEEVEIEVDDVGAVINNFGHDVEKLRTEPGHGLCRASANKVKGLSTSSALLLGAFNRLPAGVDGKTSWYFESVQEVTEGTGPTSDGMARSLATYTSSVEMARAKEVARRQEAEELAKERARIMSNSSRAEWRKTKEGALKVGRSALRAQSECKLAYGGEPGEFVTHASYSEIFNALIAECSSASSRSFSPFKSIETMLTECTEKFTRENDHHVTVLWVNNGTETSVDALWLLKMQTRIEELAQLRIFVRVCVTPIQSGNQHENGLMANAISSLTFDTHIRSVECLSRGDGAISRPPLWAKLSVREAINAIAVDVIDVGAYFQLAVEAGSDCKIPLTVAVKVDDFAGFGGRDADGSRVISGSSVDLSALTALLGGANAGDRPTLVWNHRPQAQPMSTMMLVDWLRVQLCSLFLSTENPGRGVKSFYWGKIHTTTAEELLSAGRDGTYLLRKDMAYPHPYIVSVVSRKTHDHVAHVRHIPIESSTAVCRTEFRVVPPAEFSDSIKTEAVATMEQFIANGAKIPLLACFNVGDKVCYDECLLQTPRKVPANYIAEDVLFLEQVEGKVPKRFIAGLILEMTPSWFVKQSKVSSIGVNLTSQTSKQEAAAELAVPGRVNPSPILDKQSYDMLEISVFLQKVAEARVKSSGARAPIFKSFDATADGEPSSTVVIGSNQASVWKLQPNPWLTVSGTPTGQEYMHQVRAFKDQVHHWASSWHLRLAEVYSMKKKELIISLGAVVEEPEEEEPEEEVHEAKDAEHMQAGEKVTLSSDLTTVQVISRWDGGVDLDAGIVLFKEDKTEWNHCDYNNQNVANSTVTMDHDAQGGSNQQEILTVNLQKLPADVTCVICAVCVYSSGSTFSKASNVAIEINNTTGGKSDLLAKASADGVKGLNDSTGLLLGAFRRTLSSDWWFESIQEPVKGDCKKLTSTDMNAALVRFVKGGSAAQIAAAAKKAAEKEAKRIADEKAAAQKRIEEQNLGAAARAVRRATASAKRTAASKAGCTNRQVLMRLELDSCVGLAYHSTLSNATSSPQQLVKAIKANALKFEAIKANTRSEQGGNQLLLFDVGDIFTLLKHKADGHSLVKTGGGVEWLVPTVLLENVPMKVNFDDLLEGIKGQLAESLNVVMVQADKLDRLFVKAAVETKALHANSFTNVDDVMHFLRENWHAELLEDGGVQDPSDPTQTHTAKDLFFRAIVDNDPTPFCLGRARAWIVSVKQQITNWMTNISAYSGAKLLHLVLHMDLQRLNQQFASLYSLWLSAREKHWRKHKNAGAQGAQETTTSTDDVFNYSLHDHSDGDVSSTLHPQEWLKKKSSLPQLEEFHPVLRELELERDRQRMHTEEQLERLDERGKIEFKRRAEQDVRNEKAAAAEAAAAAEEFQLHAAEESERDSALASAKAERMSAIKKTFSFGIGESSSDAGDRFAPTNPSEPEWITHRRDRLKKASNDALVKVTMAMPAGFSYAVEKSSGKFIIIAIESGGSAAQTGQLEEGMRFVEVNEVEVTGVTKAKVDRLVNSSHVDITLTIETTAQKLAKPAPQKQSWFTPTPTPEQVRGADMQQVKELKLAKKGTKFTVNIIRSKPSEKFARCSFFDQFHSSLESTSIGSHTYFGLKPTQV